MRDAMKSKDLLIRCMIYRDGDLFIGVCLDYDLMVQSETMANAKEKLNQQVREYVADALVGEDHDYADQLLDRRAPFKYFLMYYGGACVYKILHFQRFFINTFRSALPVVPANSGMTAG